MKRLSLFFAVIAPFIATAYPDELPSRWSLTPLPIMFSSPDTGLAGGGMVMVVGAFAQENPDQLSDVYSLGAFYTYEQQSRAFLSAIHYTAGNGLRLGMDASVSRFPARFFGIGPDSDIDEAYTPFEGTVDATTQIALARGLYVGPRFRYYGSTVLEKTSGGALDGGSIRGGDGASGVGPGFRVTYESRDSPLSASRGYFVDFAAAVSCRSFGGSADYSLFALDARSYASPFGMGGLVVASRLFASAALGDTPFQELPSLGGDKLMRGLYIGRFRDNSLVILQEELRVPLWWRFGVVLFASAGQVGSSLSSIDLGEAKLSGGIGFRFLVDPQAKVGLRADIALSSGAPLLYINIGEAY